MSLLAEAAPPSTPLREDRDDNVVAWHGRAEGLASRFGLLAWNGAQRNGALVRVGVSASGEAAAVADQALWCRGSKSRIPSVGRVSQGMGYSMVSRGPADVWSFLED